MHDLIVMLVKSAQSLHLAGRGWSWVSAPALPGLATAMGVAIEVVRRRLQRLVDGGWLAPLRGDKVAPLWLLHQPEVKGW